jgi:Fe(3+) dicitrate transport protein
MMLLGAPVQAQTRTGRLTGKVRDESGMPIADARILVDSTSFGALTDQEGFFQLDGIPYGTWTVKAEAGFMKPTQKSVTLETPELYLDFTMNADALELPKYTVYDQQEPQLGMKRMRSVENFGVYAGKKNEVIVPRELDMNAATNNARQLYAKIVGLNIWESDQAGLQLGIGGRGLNPNRTSNFNTRQNGYDISADALGYPESYYTPPAEALEQIEILRGAASLQYGTQFGGLLNFRFKTGPEDQKFSFLTRQSGGSWGFFNSFNSIGGTVADGKLNYYGYYQYKRGDGYRPNSGFDYQNAYASVTYQASDKLSINVDLTKMVYEAQQPGGLTDRLFLEDPRQSVRSRNWFAVDWNLASFSTTYKFDANTELNWRNFVLQASRESLGNLERINVFDDGGNRTLITGDFQNFGSELRLIKRYKIGEKNQVLLVGARVYDGRSNAMQGDGTNGSGPDFFFLNPDNVEGSDYEFKNLNYAFFAENVFFVSPRFTITPGIRAEYIGTFSDGFYKQRVFDGAGNLISEVRIDESDSRRRTILLAGVGTSYKMNENIEFYGNFSQNYRAINFTDLRIVNPNFRVDPDIRDERGFTADAGIRGNWKDFLNYDANVFMISYKDKIGQVLRADQPPLFIDYRERGNISDARMLGIEAFGEVLLSKFMGFQPGRKLSLFVNTSIIHARYINSDDTSIQNNEVEMAPPFLLRTGLSYRTDRFSATLQGGYTAQHFTDATNAVLTSTAVEGIIPAYKVVDLSMAYRIKRFTLEANVNNLLNEAYFTRRAESYPGPGIIPSDGRGFYFTVQFAL